MGRGTPEQEIRIDANSVEAREVDGELVILDLKSQRYIGGNRSTAVLWPLLVQGATRDAMADRLVAEYEIDREQAVSDSQALIDALAELQLLDLD